MTQIVNVYFLISPPLTHSLSLFSQALKMESQRYKDQNTFPAESGQNPVNKKKNRFKDILPCKQLKHFLNSKHVAPSKVLHVHIRAHSIHIHAFLVEQHDFCFGTFVL